ncbi:MAG TPA: Sip1-related alpha-galactosidase [Bacteroidota bacterium]|nr:Sip1-related alpha-galactosidase [Bacteroidota bacterium]
MSQPSVTDLHPLVSVTGNALEVSAGGSVRLSGGTPGWSDGTVKFTETRGGDESYFFTAEGNSVRIAVRVDPASDILLLACDPPAGVPARPDGFIGFFFSEIPAYARGVSFWRYSPWKCWSKPEKVEGPAALRSDDLQFFYWQYADGMYGAAMPLSGNGYRSTLGADRGRFGVKAVSYFDARGRKDIPLLAVGFGSDPYALFASLWEAGMRRMGHPENLRNAKAFPGIFERIGWCTWNSSSLGKNLSEDLLLKGAANFRDAHFPVGWFLVDDGWFDNTRNMLNAFRPDTTKFPRGFAHVVATLKREYHLRDVGVWHAMNGYWRGINPDAGLGRKFANDLVTYTEPEHADREDSPLRTCTFISPAGDAPERFYDALHAELADAGFTFVKVDNQLSVERIAPGNFPIWDGAAKYHEALNASVARHFGGAIINCMDMTPDAWANFGATAVARTSEDYFPYEKGETYNLQHGNAAAHVLQAVYNALYFSQMVYPDFDEFQSHNPNGVFHAIARALNDGPIYITDDIGKSDFGVLRPLVYGDGRILRADDPLLPCEDCLFQVQDGRPFKAFSRVGGTGLLALFNCADAESVAGAFSPRDVHGIRGGRFALYEHFSGNLTFAGPGDETRVTLGRLGYRLYSVIPLEGGKGIVGLTGKYNSPATVRDARIAEAAVTFTLCEGGAFAACAPKRPASVSVNGKSIPFGYRDGLITATAPAGDAPWTTTVVIRF